ncbi:hypothetical protein C8J57DRAFT_1657969 [Mycena rebaudengoi]|nr:hypothetical protein C8J57DRAFT_1657969 [Mycena rebaudengoi]
MFVLAGIELRPALRRPPRLNQLSRCFLTPPCHSVTVPSLLIIFVRFIFHELYCSHSLRYWTSFRSQGSNTVASITTDASIESTGDLNSSVSVPPDEGKTTARTPTAGPSSTRDAGQDFINSLGLRELAPNYKMKVDAVQAEMRTNEKFAR